MKYIIFVNLLLFITTRLHAGTNVVTSQMATTSTYDYHKQLKRNVITAIQNASEQTINEKNSIRQFVELFQQFYATQPNYFQLDQLIKQHANPNPVIRKQLSTFGTIASHLCVHACLHNQLEDNRKSLAKYQYIIDLSDVLSEQK